MTWLLKRENFERFAKTFRLHWYLKISYKLNIYKILVPWFPVRVGHVFLWIAMTFWIVSCAAWFGIFSSASEFNVDKSPPLSHKAYKIMDHFWIANINWPLHKTQRNHKSMANHNRLPTPIQLDHLHNSTMFLLNIQITLVTLHN